MITTISDALSAFIILEHEYCGDWTPASRAIGSG
jgi:hypothetical protein